MIKKYFSFLLFTIFISTPSFLLGQEQPELLKWFDSQIGIENTRLLNGTAYVDSHRTINNKNKLYGGATGTGSVLYDGQWFPDLQMRYNIFDDVLVVQLESGMGLNIIQLVKEKVSRFTLNAKNFINIEKSKSPDDIAGFHQIVWEDKSFTLLKKHALKIIEKRDRQVSYYEFEPIEGYYAFTFENQTFLLGSRNDLIKVFPELREHIQTYYRTHQSLQRSRPETFYTNLFRDLQEEVQKLSNR
ncbi:MAG TPA: hypothetical protein VK941_01630 [Gillisia sp.]|nr:hypothetical protein [Gillisia sp.]